MITGNLRYYHFAVLLFVWIVGKLGLAIAGWTLWVLFLPWFLLGPIALFGLILKKRWGLYLSIATTIILILINLAIIGLAAILYSSVSQQMQSNEKIENFDAPAYLSMYTQSMTYAGIEILFAVITLFFFFKSKEEFGIKIVPQEDEFKDDWEK